jgi:RHS repeat-associated protein
MMLTCGVPNHYKFTGKERDTESGLDDFGARYYASSMGRFTSPDWSAVPSPVPYGDFTNPQSLNLYSYVGNNPLSYVDSDGHDPDVNFQNQDLEDMFNRIAAESPSFSSELDAAKADHNIQVTVNEVGVQKLPDHAPGDAVVTLNSDGSIKVVINVKRDDERTSEHELGHEKDARTNTAQFRADGKQDAKVKGGPNEKPRDERPIEQRANKFRDQVEKERKQHRQEEKERKRREKEERKKKKANENQSS